MSNDQPEKINYTALTIGPMSKTMSQARKSRHLWGASYLFSYIMKRLLINILTDEEANVKEKEILLPHTSLKELKKENTTGTGVYPDRLFAIDNNKKIANKISLYQQDIINILVSAAGSEYKAFLENYLRIYAVSYSLPIDSTTNLSNNKSDYKNIIWVGNKLLDSIELKEKYFADITNIKLDKIIDDLNGKLLYKDAFGKNNQADYQFPSVIEIATNEFDKENSNEYQKLVKQYLKDENNPEAQQNFLDALKASTEFNGLRLLPYHKYMVVVQADGDNIGKTIAAIGNKPSLINDFSIALFEFAKEASIEIDKNYGGKPVYAGGDDLFFFAPLAVQEINPERPVNYIRTIFDLIRRIDEIFREKIIENEKLKNLYSSGVTTPSLSYGVSVIYYKYPLNEAREIADNLLHRAKEKKDDKNKICFKVLRHSGQGFGFTVDKKEPKSFDYFSNVCNKIPEDAPLLSSLIFKLAPLHAVINDIGNDIENDKQRMHDLFEESFNEPHHKIPDIKNFLNHARDFISQLFIDFPDDKEGMPEYETEERNSNLAKLYSTLRFLKMLVEDE